VRSTHEIKHGADKAPTLPRHKAVQVSTSAGRANATSTLIRFAAFGLGLYLGSLGLCSAGGPAKPTKSADEVSYSMRCAQSAQGCEPPTTKDS
jgi:hypothetical protein